MSSIITFFVADDDATADGVTEGGPRPDMATAEYGNFDVHSTLIEWESLLTGRDVMDLIRTGGPDIISDVDAPPLVMALPATVRDGLAGADRGRLAELAAGWIPLREEEGQEIDPELADDLIGEVADLCVRAAKAGHGVYVWVC